VTINEISKVNRLSVVSITVTHTYTLYPSFLAIPPTTMAPSTSTTPRPRSDLMRFSTHHHLRQRILLSVLSGKSLRIDNIRSDDVHVGLRDYEVNLLRLVEKVTNGSTIEISVTGMFSSIERLRKKGADG
jgi:hypothetical protein